MKKNLGSIDRIARVLIAVVVAMLYFTGVISGVLAIVLLSVSAVLMLTSFVSFCPLYAPFGIRTCKLKEE